MTDKTRWLGLGPWHEDNESELIDWTAQPQYKGLVKGDYYHAELRYSGRWGDPGHKGELDVVFDDDGKIAFNPAVELSYLDSYQQRAVLDAMALNDCTPSHAQSIRLKKLAQEGLLDDQTIYAVLAETKPNQQEQLKFKREELRKYFPSGYTEEQMRRDIIKGLELLKRQRERNRDAR
mgnify:CR=1 FL=1